MLCYGQWMTQNPSGWFAFDSADWPRIHSRREPDSESRLDGEPGWIGALCVQGVVFRGDHLAIEPIPNGGIRVWQIDDDPDDWDRTEFIARSVEFYPLAPDPAFGYAYNTKTVSTVYTDRRLQEGHNQLVLPWDRRPRIDAALIRHGIWADHRLWEEHSRLRKTHGWREWTDGVPNELVRDGKVVDQRRRGRYLKPHGTITYFHNTTNDGTLSLGKHNNRLGLTAGGVGQETGQSLGTTGTIQWAAVTASGQPNFLDWPTGDYRAQLDVPTVDTDIIFGLLTIDTALGGFQRIDSSLAVLGERHQQQQAAFQLSGLHLATTGSVSWISVAQSDRFLILVTAAKTGGHGTGNMVMELGETDDFADGPWPSGEQNFGLFFGPGF